MPVTLRVHGKAVCASDTVRSHARWWSTALRVHDLTHMPKTYDEIVRKTVPEPDSSFRPSPEQVRQAYEGFRALDADEQALKDRVEAALGAHPNV